MTAANVVHIRLVIGPDEYLRVYKGSAKNVFARDVRGRSISFPAKILQPFVTRNGIAGMFAIAFSDTGKFLSIEKLDDH